MARCQQGGEPPLPKTWIKSSLRSRFSSRVDWSKTLNENWFSLARLPTLDIGRGV